jgi:hypothetical protein
MNAYSVNLPNLNPSAQYMHVIASNDIYATFINNSNAMTLSQFLLFGLGFCVLSSGLACFLAKKWLPKSLWFKRKEPDLTKYKKLSIDIKLVADDTFDIQWNRTSSPQRTKFDFDPSKIHERQITIYDLRSSDDIVGPRPSRP